MVMMVCLCKCLVDIVSVCCVVDLCLMVSKLLLGFTTDRCECGN